MPKKPENAGSSAGAAVLDSQEAAEHPLLDVRDLKVHFTLQGGLLQRLVSGGANAVKAVDGVSFTLREGEVLGVVGESGSGKSTLGRALLGLVASTGGSVRMQGRELAGLREREFRRLRQQVQMIFQDPHAALNPAMELGTALAHPLRIHGLARSAEEARQRVCETLERVGLSPPEQYLNKLPGGLSGGQKQRAVIARAIICGPQLLVADEPVSMLDMSVRAKILELMLDLRKQLGLTYVYITHDLATAKFFCDRVAIMYLGRIVEIGTPEEVYADPKHPYTRALLGAIPEPDPTKAVPRDLPRGEIPDAARPPLGCSFHPRCPKAFEVCGWESRDLRQLLEQRWVEVDEQTYEAERSLVGSLDALDQPSHRAVVPAGKNGSPKRLLELFEAIRDEHPDEPLWQGVRDMSVTESGVAVTFLEGTDPGLYETGTARAACLLHDPQLRAQSAQDTAGTASRET